MFALLFSDPVAAKGKAWTKPLLQWSVVGLGFGVDLVTVARAGSSGLAYTAAGIAFAMAAGLGLGRLLKVRETTAYLISVGTAICGGSAIAAVGPIVGADQEEMSVSLGTVFLLNSAALLLFPLIGSALVMTQEQFGLWAALAIHDTSSVVGAAVKYGPQAAAVGTTVKLARALWIVPLCLATAALRRKGAKIQWPWFIGLFVLAAALRTYLPAGEALWGGLNQLARAGLRVTLFLIGAGLSRAALAKVGWRPLAQGVLLWLIVAAGSAALILR